MLNGKKKYIDLHIHTNYSDGGFTPTEVVNYARKIGLSAIAITDHDIVDGIEEALFIGEKCSIEVVPGVELSAKGIDTFQEEMHILGYYIDWKNKGFQEKLYSFRQARKERAYKILEKLHSLGVRIKEEDVFKSVKKGSLGRLHFARVLLKEKYVKNTTEAFKKYLGYKKPAYVPKLNWRPEEAIKCILEVGGIPILAHPLCENVNKESLEKLIKFGLVGIEIYHSKHKDVDFNTLQKSFSKYGLLFTGGTDCHGRLDNNPPLMGTIKIPYSILGRLKEYRDFKKTEKKR